MKGSYGDLGELILLGKNKENSYTVEQLLDERLKVTGGENRIEVTERMEKAFNRIFSENVGKRVAIVSHGASIKFLLMKWCDLGKNYQIEFNKNIITLESPSIIRLIFEDEKLKELIQIV